MKSRSLTDRTCRLLALCAICATFVFQHRGAAASDSDFFKQKVAPIFERNCVMCHGARVQRSGLDLRSEETTLKGGARGHAVVPGDAGKSRLYRLIAHKEEPAMPMGMDKLGDPDVAVIAQWINGLSPKAAMAVETIPTRQPGYSITEKDRQFWSFVKPVRPALPKVKDRRWMRNEIDAFVLSKLEQNGLRPNRAASPRELLRRVYFDLTGLPPSPEETAEFLKNPSEAAYAKVVDRLLASPHYGERWGRHWLDLARYADSGGYEFDYDRPHAWRYRDYVIKSFNEDKPYNRFIIEQLAGDQLDGVDVKANPEALIPTGFVRNGPTVAEANDDAEFVALQRAVDERLPAGEAPLGGRRFAPRRTTLHQSPLALENGADQRARAASVMPRRAKQEVLHVDLDVVEPLAVGVGLQGDRVARQRDRMRDLPDLLVGQEHRRPVVLAAGAEELELPDRVPLGEVIRGIHDARRIDRRLPRPLQRFGDPALRSGDRRPSATASGTLVM